MKRLVIVLIALFAVGAAAFTTMGGLSWLDSIGLRGSDRLVQSRVNAYWDARVDGDLEIMVKYMHPDQHVIPDPGLLITEAYELQGLAIEGDAAVASLTVRSRLKHPMLSSRNRTVEIQQRWVQQDGEWYIQVMPVGFAELVQSYTAGDVTAFQTPAAPATP